MRVARGFLTIGQSVQLGCRIGALFDPFSTLISRHAEIGPDTIVYPGVTVECDADSVCVLGAGNILFPGLRITATAGGSVLIGGGNQLGEGGARISAHGTGTTVRIGDRARIDGGAHVTAGSVVGTGAQVLGPISARDVRLADGEDWTYPDPDMRGAVLKGHGTARGTMLAAGEVVNGNGEFVKAPTERQRQYHPNAPRTSRA